jgi:glycogen debranching enzyme
MAQVWIWKQRWYDSPGHGETLAPKVLRPQLVYYKASKEGHRRCPRSGQYIKHAYPEVVMPTEVLSGTHVLMQGETFAVFDLHGNINTAGQGKEGLYHQGTRFLSHLVLQLGETQPVLLNSAVQENNVLLTVDLTNPELCVGDSIVFQYGFLHLRRLTLLWQGVCYYRFYLRNYGMTSLATTLSIEFDADYADIFEVRGVQRSQRGRLLKSITEGGQVLLGYEGMDGVVRQTRVVFTPTPAALADRQARFEVYLPLQGEATIDLSISCELAGHSSRALSFDHVASAVGRSLRTAEEDGCTISTSNGQFDAWLHRSRRDLAMLVGPNTPRPLPLCWRPLVQHTFRAGWPNYGFVMSVDRPRVGPGSPGLSGRDPGR